MIITTHQHQKQQHNSTNSAWPSTGVCRTRHRLIWSRRAHWSQMSPADNTSVRFCHRHQLVVPRHRSPLTGEPHLAFGPSVLRALWHGMRCLTTSEIRRWDASATHFAIFAAFKESMTLNLAQRSFKVIHFGGNRKPAYDFISLYRPFNQSINHF